MSPLHPCPVPHCSTLTTGGRCAVHQRGGWVRPPGADIPPRIRGRLLQRKRQELFARSPLCVLCTAEDRISAATIRDHIVPLAEGGEDTDANTQGLCQRCSDAKTASESQRSRARSRGPR